MNFCKLSIKWYLLFALLNIGSVTFGQDPENIPLQDVFKYYEKKFQVSFLYDNDLIQGVKVKIDTSQVQLDQLIDLLNDQSAFKFEITNSTILVKPLKQGANVKICGIVQDKEAGIPLPGASIYDKKKSIGISSDQNGRFETFIRLTEENKIIISMVGFEKKELPVSDFNNATCPSIFLNPDVKILNDVVITAYMATGIDYSLMDNSIIVNSNGMGLLPGETDADVLMAIDALPGVNSPDSKAGNLIIRGSSPDQSLITFDDIPIYHKGHYFGTFSPYNSNVVDHVKVFRSAYAANKGGRVGGVIEINSKSKVADSTKFIAGISGTYASGFTEIPLGKKISLLLAGRLSYPSNWISPKLKAINEFIYQQSDVTATEKNPSLHLNQRDYHFNDFNAKLITKPSDKDWFTISFLNIDNKVNIEIQNDQVNSISYNYMHLKNTGVNVQWDRQWNQKFLTHISATHSSYDQSYPSKIIVLPDSVNQDAYFENKLNDYSLKLSNQFSISSKSSLSVGYDLQSTEQKYEDRSLNSTLVQENTMSLHSFYGNYTLASKLKYTLTTGIRANYYSLSKDFKIEPRLMFNYFLNDHVALKTSAGKFHQYINQISGFAIESVGGIENLVWLIADEKKVPIVESTQFMVGAMYHKNSWLFDLELYRNEIKNITINDIINFSDDFLYGRGWTYGADILLKKQWQNFNTWISYTISQSNLQFDSIQSTSFDFIYNQNHVLDFVVEYRVKQWKFSTGWKYRTGLPALTGIRAKYLHGEPNQGANQGPPPPPGPPPSGPPPLAPNSPKPFENNLSAYHQLDLSIVYGFPKNQKNWSGSLGLSLINIYDRENIIEQVPRRTRQGSYIDFKYAIGFAPNLMLTITW